MRGDLIHVEVTYALPHDQALIGLDVPEGTTVSEAVQRSGILARYPEIDLERSRVGVFGKLRSPGDVLRAGDRVEIYRPLKVDPKQVRRERAAKAGQS